MISVVVVTYNPIWEKLKLTIDSIIMQENIDVEIIVSDDGSKDNLFKELEVYLCKMRFENYKLIGTAHNHGTVHNVFKGVSASKGEFVKLISPGDFLADKKILSVWEKSLVNSGRAWSFSDAIYYESISDKSINTLVRNANPQNVAVYLKNQPDKIRWNYVVLNDVCLGAATLCRRDVFLKYIERIVGKVIYTEDCIYKLMMYDGEIAHYFDMDAVFYEYGSGISTQKNDVWYERITNDWMMSYREMLNYCNHGDLLQNEMQQIFIRINNGNNSLLKKALIRGKIISLLKEKMFKRKTSVDLSDNLDFLRELI